MLYPHTYISSPGYYKKNILLVYYYLHRIYYALEMKGCGLQIQTNLKGLKVEMYEVDFYSLQHGKKTAIFKKCERNLCPNNTINAPNHHYCTDCMIDQAIFIRPLVKFMNN